MKKIFSLIFSGIVFMSSTAFGFSDLTESHWAYHNVMNMHSRGLVSGFSDNTFKPNDALTRAQFITMMVKSLGIEEDISEVKFDDIANHWAAKYINIAGSVMCDDTKKFNPENEALREDVAMAIVRINGLEYSEYDVNTLNAFSDLHSIASNRRKYVAIAVENGFMKGNANGTFNPKGALTRAEGATVVKNLFENETDVVKGYEEIIPHIYDWVDNFSNGLALVQKNEKYGYIDKEGKEIIPCIYDGFSAYMSPFEFVAFCKDGKWGYVDKENKEVVMCDYEYIYPFIDEMALVQKNWKWGFIDQNGKEVVPCIYDFARSFFEEGTAEVKQDGKYGFIDKQGNQIVPCIYTKTRDFSEEMAAVQKNEKWGFVNKEGKEVIPCMYDYVGSFSDGLAAVGKNEKYGYINKDGEEVISCVYDYVGIFSDGLAVVEKNKKMWIYKQRRKRNYSLQL